jgi:hypothetical protein
MDAPAPRIRVIRAVENGPKCRAAGRAAQAALCATAATHRPSFAFRRLFSRRRIRRVRRAAQTRSGRQRHRRRRLPSKAAPSRGHARRHPPANPRARPAGAAPKEPPASPRRQVPPALPALPPSVCVIGLAAAMAPAEAPAPAADDDGTEVVAVVDGTAFGLPPGHFIGCARARSADPPR